MFVCDKNFSCCDYQYADKITDLDAEARICPHLLEVAYIIHAHWIPSINTTVVCSHCHFVEDDYGTNFCGNCGAKMDEL